MAVKSYLSRLLGIRHTTGAPTVLDCESLDIINLGDATATTLTATTVTAAVVGDVTGTADTASDVVVGSDAAGDMHYKSSATATARLAKGTTGQIITSNGSVPAWSTVSGDITMVSGGATTIGANKVLSSMVSPLLIKYATVSLSAAQASALNSAPQTLVAAASGSIHVIHRAVAVLNYSGGAITGNGIVGLYETDSAGAVLTGTLTLASFLGASADTVKELHPLAHSATTGLTRLDNKAIVLSQATGDSTIGDSTSTVDVHLWYSTIPHGL